MTTDTPKSGYATSTHGWDTAFAIPVPDVNKAIVDKKSSPPNMSYTDPSSKATLSCDFGNWQITMGGDGENVRMEIPLTNIKLTYSTGHSHTVPKGTAVAEIELEYLPHTTQQEKTNGQPMALKPKTTSQDPLAPVFNVIDMVLDPDPGIVTHAVIQQTLTEWGCAHLAVFDHIFAVVDINRIVDKDNWAFVTPHYTGYAYLDGKSLEESLFGVLTMTGDRSGKDLTQQIAFNAIPPGSVSGFLISQVRTLLDLVRPAIMQAYPGLTNDNFLLSEDQETLYLTQGTTVDLKPVQHDGNTYYPKLTSLSLQSNGSIFTLTSHTTTEVVPGIIAENQATHWYTLKLGTCNNGQTLKFEQYQQPSIVHSIHQSPGSHVTQIIIDIVAALALIILTILTDGAALILGGLAIGLLIGATNIIPPLIEKANKDDSPSIDLLQVNAVDPITWPSSREFKLTYGSLNMSMQLGGDPQFI